MAIINYNFILDIMLPDIENDQWTLPENYNLDQEKFINNVRPSSPESIHLDQNNGKTYQVLQSQSKPNNSLVSPPIDASLEKLLDECDLNSIASALPGLSDIISDNLTPKMIIENLQDLGNDLGGELRWYDFLPDSEENLYLFLSTVTSNEKDISTMIEYVKFCKASIKDPLQNLRLEYFSKSVEKLRNNGLTCVKVGSEEYKCMVKERTDRLNRKAQSSSIRPVSIKEVVPKTEPLPVIVISSSDEEELAPTEVKEDSTNCPMTSEEELIKDMRKRTATVVLHKTDLRSLVKSKKSRCKTKVIVPRPLKEVKLLNNLSPSLAKTKKIIRRSAKGRVKVRKVNKSIQTSNTSAGNEKNETYPNLHCGPGGLFFDALSKLEPSVSVIIKEEPDYKKETSD